MKKIIAAIMLTVGVFSCQQVNSPYASNILFWGQKIVETGVAAAFQSKLMAEAIKNKKTDSAIYYGLQVSQLAAQELIYKDSLAYYIKLSKAEIDSTDSK